MTLNRSLLLALTLSATLFACGDKEPDGDDDTGSTSDDTGSGGDDTGPVQETIEAVSATLLVDDGDTETLVSTTQLDNVGSVDVTATALTGSTTWDSVTTTVDGGAETTNCDAELSLSGTPYAGDCMDCDFAFDMTSTVTSDAGLTDCNLPIVNTFTESAVYKSPILMFWSDFSETDDYGNTTEYSNFLRTGVSIDYSAYGGYYYAGPYFGTLAFDGPDYYGEYSKGSATFTAGSAEGEGTLDWTWSYNYETSDKNYYNVCEAVQPADATDDPELDAVAGTSGLACSGEQIDVWEVSLSAGDTFLATVDTVAADTAFDPWFYLNTPDTCLTAYSDDAFDCAFPPADYQCPGMEVDIDDDGTYQIVVASYDSCTGESGEYELNTGRLVAGR